MKRSIALTLLVSSLAVAGCGGDDKEPASGGGSTTTEEAPAEPATLQITGSGTPKNPSFELSATEVPAGLVNISYTFEGQKGELDGQLVRVDGEHAVDEVLEQLKFAVTGKPVEDWFQAVGGAGGAEPGETETATQNFEPGTYYVLGGEGDQGGNPASFQVTGTSRSGELPATEGGTISASEYKFEATGLTAGANQVTLENTGSDWHHFIGFPILEGATIDEVKKFFETEKGKPPVNFNDKDAFGTAVLDPGQAQIVELDLNPGRYALICFVQGREGGPPHVARGMVSEVEVP